VEAAVALLSETSRPVDARMRALGELINMSHLSLRERYEVSTPEVEALIAVIQDDPQVYGARLMGGGFGGNVLALTTDENAQSLIDRAQNEFYGPRGRDGVGAGSVMVSTPGDGLELLNL
jgi:galactokinase